MFSGVVIKFKPMTCFVYLSIYSLTNQNSHRSIACDSYIYCICTKKHAAEMIEKLWTTSPTFVKCGFYF